MKPDALAPLRMQGLRLWGTRFETPQQVVRWLGALQAQEFPLAKWSIAQRTRGATRADVDQAFADGVIVRTHVLRPTWHFALAEDIRWLLQATAPRVHAVNAYYNKQHELDQKLFTKTNTLIARALEGGAHLTRRLVGNGDAPFVNAVLLDGRLIGHWKPVAERNSILVKTVLNRALTPQEKKAVTAAVALTAAWMSGK
jgi:hypothetical protein